MMFSHVYVLQHAEQPWIKIGKADVLLTRFQILGLSRFDLHGSFAVEVASSDQALRLESVLHRLFADVRIPSERVLAVDPLMAGFTEWFDASCRAQLERVLASIGEQIPHRRMEPAEFRARLQHLASNTAETSRLRDLEREQQRQKIEERIARQQAKRELHERALAVEAAQVRQQLRLLEPVLRELTDGLAQCFLLPPALRPAPGEFRALLLGSCDAALGSTQSAQLASFEQSAPGQAFRTLCDTHIDRQILRSWAKLSANPGLVLRDGVIYLCLDLYWTDRAEQAAWSPLEVFNEFRLRIPGWDIALRAAHLPDVLTILAALELSDRRALNGRPVA